MVKHIVMFKLAEKNQANIEKAVNALRNMEGKIETLRFLEVGIDFKGSERSYDIVLTTQFDDREGLQVYAEHKIHQPVIQTMQKLCSSSVVVDYELA
ncbi:MAG: Dabb family protein [Nitrospinales bacterium]